MTARLEVIYKCIIKNQYNFTLIIQFWEFMCRIGSIFIFYVGFTWVNLTIKCVSHKQCVVAIWFDSIRHEKCHKLQCKKCITSVIDLKFQVLYYNSVISVLYLCTLIFQYESKGVDKNWIIWRYGIKWSVMTDLSPYSWICHHNANVAFLYIKLKATSVV